MYHCSEVKEVVWFLVTRLTGGRHGQGRLAVTVVIKSSVKSLPPPPSLS
jgi:hypothetical protein